MTIDAEHIYAVVRHASGRIDFEPLDALMTKNRADFDAGNPVKRSVLQVADSTVKAQEIAKGYRDQIKQREAKHE